MVGFEKKENRKPKREILVLVEPSRVYGQGVVRGLFQYALEKGNWIIRLDENRSTYESVVDRIRSWKGDGIISRSWSRNMLKELEKVSCPVVELYGDGDTMSGEVQNDNEQIATMAADYLLGLGYRRLAFYSYGDIGWIRDRSYHFRARIQQAGASCEVLSQILTQRDLINPLWSSRFEDPLCEWLKGLPKPIAIWTPSDRQATHVLEQCLRLSIRIPEDVALLGVDDDSLLCNIQIPTLSSIKTDPVRIGYTAASLLDQRFHLGQVDQKIVQSEKERKNEKDRNKGTKSSKQTEQIFIPPLFVVSRQSTEMTAIDDPDVVQALEMIREQAVSGLTVGKLVAFLNIAQNTLRRRFLKYLGRTPEQEIKRVRIERARELLAETDLSYAKIAELTGYGAQEYFAKSFLQEVGVTPKVFRQKSK